MTSVTDHTDHTARVAEDPWWLGPCKEELKKIDPNAKLCPENHCLDSQTYMHKVCYCEPPYANGCSPNRTPGCCSYTAISPVIVFNADGTNCYCCCGCFANETLLASGADQVRPVEEFAPGDPLWVALDVGLSSWAAVPVQFASGTGPESQNTMIRVSFGEAGAPEEIFVTREQVMMVRGHRLKRASRLVPGLDALVRADGGLAPVLDLAAGVYQKGVHQVATSESPTTDPSGHLLVANGVVCGDFSLQVTDLEAVAPGLLVDGHAELPEFGTKEYGERYTHLLADSFAARPPQAGVRESAPGVFEAFSLMAAPDIPSAARSLFTRAQAEDIARNTVQAPASAGAGTSITTYLFKLFKGFYPDVVFYLDNTADLPNAYAFRQYGTPFVIINGGFLRVTIVRFEVIAFAIAQALGHLYGGPPLSKEGYTCTGAADYAALLAVFPYVWFAQFARPYMDGAITQMEELFAKIDQDHRHGRPGDTCVRISVDCRIEAMRAAARTGLLPQCAGGPPPPTLAVTGASGRADDEGGHVAVTFSEPVDVASAEAVGSYEFSPVTPATSATVDPADPARVTIRAAVQAGHTYTIRAVEVLSAHGNPVIPSRSRATFTTEEG